MIGVRTLLAGCVLAILAQPANSASLVGQELISTTSDDVITRYKITSQQFDKSDTTNTTPLYVIKVKTAGEWQPLCQPDSQGRRTAIPLLGKWDEAGAYQPSDKLTFACTKGVLAKCILWGYAPWNPSHPGWTMRQLHQTCSRMARADYCGNGKSHTRDGMRIHIYDTLNIRKYDKVGDLTYEAAWGPDGATEIVHTRLGETLSDIIAECPEKNWVMKTNPKRIIRPDARSVIMNDSKP